MAPRIAEVDEPDAPAAGQSAPDLAAVLAAAAAGTTWHGVPVRVVRVELVDGRVQRLELPAGGVRPLTEQEQAVVDVLRRLHSGEWMKGRSIAAELDLEYDGGHFRALMAGLVALGRVESSKVRGYRLR